MRVFAALLAMPLWVPVSAWATSDITPQRPILVIPRVESPPALEDFLDMEPNSKVKGRLAKVTDFIQTDPSDGQPATQRTDVYLGYDEKHLYAIFICFDSEPEKIRSRMIPRDNIFDFWRGFRGDNA